VARPEPSKADGGSLMKMKSGFEITLFSHPDYEKLLTAAQGTKLSLGS